MAHTKDTYNAKLKSANILYYIVGEYFNNKKETIFYCEKHNHYFNAIPSNVFYKKTHCEFCTGNIKKHTKDTFNIKLKLSNNKYYIVGDYTNNRTETVFYCEEHEYYFNARPDDVIFGKKQCEVCSGYTFWNKDSINTELNNRNIKLIGEFINANTAATFKCLICEWEWEAKPKAVIHKTGCPCCSKTGFKFNKPGLLYYIIINFNDNIYYKIGITNYTVNKRFRKNERKMISILYTEYFENGKDAYNKEQKILKKFNDYKYEGVQILERGDSEIFTIDIREYINLEEELK